MSSRFQSAAAAVLALSCLLAACGRSPRTLPPAGALIEEKQAEYVIGAGDSLDVFVYRAPELSTAALPVRPDGRISMPLIPEIEASGRTPTALARDIEEKLKVYLIEPTVTVIVRGFVGAPSRQIRVIGEATQPLSLSYRDGMTMLDVMITARGLTRYAAGNRADIVRRDPPSAPPEIIRVRLSDLLRDGDLSQDVPMRPGDTLIIPQGWF